MEMRLFVTEKNLDAIAEARADTIVRERIAARMRLYSENPEMLRKACAAYHGVDEKHIDPDSVLLPPIAKAVRAFGEELGRAIDAPMIDHSAFIPPASVRAFGA